MNKSDLSTSIKAARFVSEALRDRTREISDLTQKITKDGENVLPEDVDTVFVGLQKIDVMFRTLRGRVPDLRRRLHPNMWSERFWLTVQHDLAELDRTIASWQSKGADKE